VRPCQIMGLDPSNPAAVADAESQLQFLAEMASAAAGSGGGGGGGRRGASPAAMTAAWLSHLQAQLALRAGRGDEALPLLEKSVGGHLACAAAGPLSLAGTFAAAAPVRVLAAVRGMAATVGSEPRSATEPPSPVLTKCLRALELLSRYVGALPAASLLAAHCLLLGGQTDAAQRKAADVLRAMAASRSFRASSSRPAASSTRPWQAA